MGWLVSDVACHGVRHGMVHVRTAVHRAGPRTHRQRTSMHRDPARCARLETGA